jgi:hypothetical protein
MYAKKRYNNIGTAVNAMRKGYYESESFVENGQFFAYVGDDYEYAHLGLFASAKRGLMRLCGDNLHLFSPDVHVSNGFFLRFGIKLHTLCPDLGVYLHQSGVAACRDGSKVETRITNRIGAPRFVQNAGLFLPFFCNVFKRLTKWFEFDIIDTRITM